MLPHQNSHYHNDRPHLSIVMTWSVFQAYARQRVSRAHWLALRREIADLYHLPREAYDNPFYPLPINPFEWWAERQGIAVVPDDSTFVDEDHAHGS